MCRGPTTLPHCICMRPRCTRVQVLAGITLLVVFAGPMLTKGFGVIIGEWVAERLAV